MTKLPSRLLAIASLSGLLLLASCGKFFVDENSPTGGTTCTTNCIYIGNYVPGSATSSDVAAFALVNPLTYVSATNVSLGDNPSAMVVNPANSYLYVASEDDAESNIYYFALESGGALGSVATALEAIPIYIGSMAIDSTGTDLIVAGAVVSASCTTGYSAAVLIYQIGTDGVLGSTATTTYETTNACITASAVEQKAIAVAPNNNAFFVSFGSYGILSFQLTASTGVASPGSTYIAAPSDTSFNGAAVDSTSAYLFASASGTSGGVYAFTIDPTTFALTQLGTPQTSSTDLYPIVVDASNKYVYAADNGNSEVYGYTFGSAGLSAIAGSPFSPSSTATGTLGMVTQGGYVVTTNETGPNIQEFTIGSTGALSAASTATTGSATSYYPTAIAITK
jgi:6-phosphogluconolactonase (cycloisomerase 2 family)